MQRSQFLGLFVLALMVLAAVPLQVSVASTTYSEKLSISIAGSDALWYLTMGNVNGSSRLSTLESVPGLSWYNVTAIKTTAWKSDFQLFGPSGYDLLPTPFIPSQGLFLTVGADSFSSAAAAARGLDSYLLSAFVSFSNDTGSYTFYSPVSFDTIVPRTLLTFLPTGAGGFANAITSSGWIGTASPVIVLGGVRAGSGFNHSLVVGSITATAIDATTKRPSVLNYFGSTMTSLQASNRSTSSSIAIKFLDGLINSSDPATVNNDRAAFMGSYTLTVAPREHIYRLNVTAMQQPALLLAYRTVNTGVLHAGDNLSVTISLSNLSNDTALQSVSFADDWWKSSHQFTLVSGNSTFSNPSMAAGVRLTPVYTLHYNGTASQRITIPAIAVGYSFKVGQLTSQGHSSLNAIPLSLGADDAVVYARVVPLGGYGKVVGAEQKVKVIATNVGTFAASSVVVAGQDVSGLAANGGSATVEVTESAQGLLGINLSKTYDVSYKNPNGVQYNASTNTFAELFSHVSMRVGYATLVSSLVMTPIASGGTGVDFTFKVTNIGLAEVTSFLSRGTLPAGLGCGITNGTGITCAAGVVSINHTSIAASTTKYAYMKVNVTTPRNYVIPPFSYQETSAGNNISGWSNPVGMPTGFLFSKQYQPSELFAGMTSTVTVMATNSGPFGIHNATVSAIVDSFDTLTGSAASNTSRLVAPGAGLSFHYGVLASSTTFGTLPSSEVFSNFYFGSTSFSVRGPGPNVTVYQPLSASITTVPASPTEGKPFTISVRISNPSAANVSSVLFTLPLPAGLSLTELENASLNSGVLTVSFGSIAAGSAATATSTAGASSGIAVPFEKAKLTFVYQGATVNGKVPSKGIAIGEDVTTRYLIPTGIVLVVLLATAFYVRRAASVSVQAAQK